MYERLDLGAPDVLGYEIKGSVTEEDYEHAASELREAIESHDSINLLVRIPGEPDTDMDSGDGPIDFVMEHDDQVNRVAVVGEASRVKWLARLGKAKIAPKVKRFDLDDEDDARAWVAG